MSTTLVQAVEVGVKTAHTDPVISQFVAQLGSLLQPWLVRQGWVVNETRTFGSYVLNGNCGYNSVYFSMTVPGREFPLRFVAEVRVHAAETTLVARLRLRKDSKTGYQGWADQDSSQVEVDYALHKGEYKLQLLTQKLRALLGVAADTVQLESTAVLPLLETLMQEEQLRHAA